MDKPVFFIATAKAYESRQFYETLLGLHCLSEDAFALVFKLGDTTLRIQKVKSIPDINYTVLGWEVANIQQRVQELSANGVNFAKFPQLSQSEMGIWSSPSGALVAWFEDPDGNTLSLTQH
jgi:catechol 2,3-dioxygenase-like lactoylglutathione lyase family enzyme